MQQGCFSGCCSGAEQHPGAQLQTMVLLAVLCTTLERVQQQKQPQLAPALPARSQHKQLHMALHTADLPWCIPGPCRRGLAMHTSCGVSVGLLLLLKLMVRTVQLLGFK